MKKKRKELKYFTQIYGYISKICTYGSNRLNYGIATNYSKCKKSFFMLELNNKEEKC